MNLRRPLSLFLLTLLLAGAWACDRTSVSISKEGSGSVESERTREMEEKAADINRQAESLQMMEGSEQDKIDAYKAPAGPAGAELDVGGW